MDCFASRDGTISKIKVKKELFGEKPFEQPSPIDMVLPMCEVKTENEDISDKNELPESNNTACVIKTEKVKCDSNPSLEKSSSVGMVLPKCEVKTENAEIPNKDELSESNNTASVIKTEKVEYDSNPSGSGTISDEPQCSRAVYASREENKNYIVKYETANNDNVVSLSGKLEHPKPIKSILRKRKKINAIERNVSFSDVDRVRFFESDTSDSDGNFDTPSRVWTPCNNLSQRCWRVDYKDPPSN